MKFYSEITLPESKRVCKVNQLSYEDYVTLNKFLQNDNDDHINDCFNQIVEKYTNCRDFTGVDMFSALLFLRMISIGSTLKLAKDNEIHQVDLAHILQKMTELNLPPVIYSVNEAIKIQLNSPNKMFNVEGSDFFFSSISRDGTQVFNAKERKDLERVLPASALIEVTNLITSIEQQLATIKVQVIDRFVTFSISDGSAFELLKTIFKDNLLVCQRRLLSIVAGFELDAAYVNSLAPIEIEILNGILQERAAAEKPASAPLIPSQPPLHPGQ